MPDVLYEKSDHIAVITLNRPDHGNSLSANVMREELPAAWQAARDDSDVRVVVFTASGDRFFCTGVDLRDPEARRGGSGSSQLRITGRQNDVWKPIISAVNGQCVGGGLMFVGDCDVVFASENARFSNSGVSLGLLAPVGPVVMARKMPFHSVMRMLIAGRYESMDAHEAYRLGLVNEVTKPEALLDTAIAFAGNVAKNSPAAVEQAVRALWDALEMPLSEALASSLKRSASLGSHPDAQEGARAWAEKREPEWKS